MNHPDAVQQLLDRQAIEDLVLRYCRAVDRRDFALLATLYHPDAIDDHGAYFSGPAADFVALLPEIIAANRLTSHNVTNMLIALDGDEAEGEICTLAYHLMDTPEGATDLLIGGRYLDRYIRHEGRWLFLHRRIVLDWNQLQPSRCVLDSPDSAGTPLGAPDQSDPSYEFFRLLRRGA